MNSWFVVNNPELCHNDITNTVEIEEDRKNTEIDGIPEDEKDEAKEIEDRMSDNQENDEVIAKVKETENANHEFPTVSRLSVNSGNSDEDSASVLDSSLLIKLGIGIMLSSIFVSTIVRRD